VTAQAPAHGDDWDFLKPASHLSLEAGSMATPGAAEPAPAATPTPAPLSRTPGILTGRERP
jgi:hypothetical protein